MIDDKDRDYIRLSTGRVLYANMGILGLTPHEPGTVFYGYDGIATDDEAGTASTDNSPLTPAERREIADRMIALWSTWAQRGPPA